MMKKSRVTRKMYLMDHKKSSQKKSKLVKQQHVEI